jgi:drug/metabolite transporter (DMT)-like permease
LLKNPASRAVAVLQALLVTFLWSTSWVLIKIGLVDIPALTFAGLRYGLAFLCLLPFFLHASHRAAWRRLSRRNWMLLIALGVLFYAITQGAQYIGLFYLPANTTSLLLNFSSVAVALLGILFLAEVPARIQWIGVALNISGILVYFYPISFPAHQITGLAVMAAGVIANAISSLLGRSVNRNGEIPPLVVTVASMGVGAILLLIAGISTQGLPYLSPLHWAIVAWLAIVNTAFAFTLWNHTLRTLSAIESSIINSTMLIQIAILAWLFLGEGLTWQKIIGIFFAGLGALVVQLRPGLAALRSQAIRLNASSQLPHDDF